MALYTFDERDERDAKPRSIAGHAAEFYVRSFVASVGCVWNGVFPEAVGDLCYRTAISSFRDSGRQQIVDRHALTYTFLQGAFSTGDPGDALDKYAGQIPTYSWVPKALKALCGTAYGDDPSRTFTTNAVAQGTLTRWYNEARANSSFRYAHEQGSLHNYTLARPSFGYDGKMEIEVLLPDTFRARFDGVFRRKMKELWIPIGTVEKRRGKPAFKVWTDTAWWITDYAGDRIGETMVNDYGIIPYVPLQMNRSQSYDDPYGGGLWDLVYANVVDNALKWSGVLSVFFNSFEVWLAVNLDFGKRRGAGLSAGAMIEMNNVMRPSAGDVMQPERPALEQAGGSGQYPMIGDYARQSKEDALFDIGVPDFLASRNGQVPTTATEWIIRYHGLLDKRRADLPALNDFEKEFAEMVCRVGNVDRREQLPEQLPEMSTDFPEINIPNSVEAELKYEAGLVAGGLYRLGKFLAKWEGLDYVPSDDDALVIMTERQAKYAPVLPLLREFVLGAQPMAAAA